MNEELQRTLNVQLTAAGSNLPAVARDSRTAIDGLAQSVSALHNSWVRFAQQKQTANLYGPIGSVGHNRDAMGAFAMAAQEQRERANRATSFAGRASAIGFGGGMGMMTGLGSLANPWALERFTKASRDLGAVIGRDLLPYLDAATRVVRGMADAYISLPSFIRSGIAGTIALGTALGGMGVIIFGVRKAIGFAQSGWEAAIYASQRLAVALRLQAAASSSAAAGATAAGAGATVAGAGAAGVGLGAGLKMAGKMALRAIPFVGTAFALYEIGSLIFNKEKKDSPSYGAASTNASYMDPMTFIREQQLDVLRSNVSLTDAIKSLEKTMKQWEEDRKALNLEFKLRYNIGSITKEEFFGRS